LPGHWFTWGNRVYWYRFSHIDEDAWVSDRYARSEGGAVAEAEDYHEYNPSEERHYLALPPDSPNLPDHIRTKPKPSIAKLKVDVERVAAAMREVRIQVPRLDWNENRGEMPF